MAKTDLRLVHVASGRVLAETLEKPRTFVGRGIGLMFRRTLPDRHGMLIDPCNGIHMLFMRFPIDAVFLDRELRVKKVVEHLRPWRFAASLGSRSVLEITAGEAARHGLEAGQRLRIE